MRRFIALATLQIALLTVAGCSFDEPAPGSAADATGAHPARERTVPAPPAAERGPHAVPAAQVDVVEVTRDAVAGPADTSEHPADVVVDHLEEGRAAFRSGDMAVAARELGLAVRDGKGVPYDRYMFGLALWRTGALDEADAVLSDLSWKMGDFARAAVNLARVRIERDDLVGAETAVTRAIESDPDFSDAHNVLGRIRLARGDVDGAAEAFHRAAELDSGNPWPLNNLGYALLVSGRPADAIDPLENAVARDDSLAVAWNNLALARERGGDLVGAFAAAARARELSGDDGEYARTAERLAALAPPTAPGEDADPARDDSASAVATSAPEAASSGGGSSSLP